MTPPQPLSATMAAAEREAIVEALDYTDGDVRAASRLLKVGERTLWYKINKLQARDLGPGE